jgi:hypothetical protein
MMDCTRARSVDRLIGVVACSVTLLLAWTGAAAGTARADGDPASDVLATQTLFLPQDAASTPAQQNQLQELLQEAASRGYPIRVAVIGSATDLGSITPLWRQPVSYAKFLGQELSLTYKGTLLVVMPNGFGLYRQQGAVPGESALGGVAAPGAGLENATLGAVTRLATAAGHPLQVPQAAAPSASGSSDIVPWLIFGAGLLLAAVAWTGSLRARPLNLSARK